MIVPQLPAEHKDKMMKIVFSGDPQRIATQLGRATTAAGQIRFWSWMVKLIDTDGDGYWNEWSVCTDIWHSLNTKVEFCGDRANLLTSKQIDVIARNIAEAKQK